jgi:exopolysaccharide biosynthesis polyprenyl glycosylphosphotransferase
VTERNGAVPAATQAAFAPATTVSMSSATGAAVAIPGPRAGAPSSVMPIAASERPAGLLPASSPRRRGWLVRRMLALADLVGLTSAFALAEILTVGGPQDHVDGLTESLLFVAFLPVWVILADVSGLYRYDEERTYHCTADELVGLIQLVTTGTWIFYAGAAATQLASPSVFKLGLFWALAVTLLAASRGWARHLCRRSPIYIQNAVIVGAGTVGQQIAAKLRHHREYGVRVVGFIDTAPRERLPSLEDVPLLGGPADLRRIIPRLQVERVVFAFSNEPSERLVELVRSLDGLDVQIDIVPRVFELIGPAAAIHTVEGIPLVGLSPLRPSRSARLMKRCLDVAVAGLGVAVLAPFFLIVALLIKLDSPGPVLFRQRRVGKGGQVFTILKLRTMHADAEGRKTALVGLNRHAKPGGDSRMFKIDDDPRITRVGRVLRKFSLDELPQLLNVLRGEMSLVGPRPLIESEARHVRDWAEKRIDLKPGITGLWQVLGRSAIPFGEMVRLDYLYATTWSLWQDCRLLLRTVPTVARGARD